MEHCKLISVLNVIWLLNRHEHDLLRDFINKSLFGLFLNGMYFFPSPDKPNRNTTATKKNKTSLLCGRNRFTKKINHNRLITNWEPKIVFRLFQYVTYIVQLVEKIYRRLCFFFHHSFRFIFFLFLAVTSFVLFIYL